MYRGFEVSLCNWIDWLSSLIEPNSTPTFFSSKTQFVLHFVEFKRRIVSEPVKWTGVNLSMLLLGQKHVLLLIPTLPFPFFPYLNLSSISNLYSPSLTFLPSSPQSCWRSRGRPTPCWRASPSMSSRLPPLSPSTSSMPQLQCTGCLLEELEPLARYLGSSLVDRPSGEAATGGAIRAIIAMVC